MKRLKTSRLHLSSLSSNFISRQMLSRDYNVGIVRTSKVCRLVFDPIRTNVSYPIRLLYNLKLDAGVPEMSNNLVNEVSMSFIFETCPCEIFSST